MVLLLWFVLSLFCTTSGFPTSELHSTVNYAPRSLLNSQKAVATANLRFLKSNYGKSFATDPKNEDACFWMAETQRCLPDLQTQMRLLSQTNSSLARIAYETFLCRTINEEAECHGVQHCTWYYHTQECDFVDYGSMYPHSPCLEAAPELFASMNAGVQCEAEGTTREDCLEHPECFWGFESDACQYDFFKAFVGISTEELRDSNKLIAEAFQSAADQFHSTFDIDQKDLDWKAVLDWRPIKECSDYESKQICEYINQIVVSAAPVSMYCSYKYASQIDCIGDPLCGFDTETLTCAAGDILIEESVSKALEELSKGIEHVGDREFIRATFACERNSIEACKKDEKCYALTIANMCIVSPEHILSFIVEKVGGDLNDPVCAFMSKSVLSSCIEIFDKEQCLEEEICTWAEDFQCTLSDIELVRSALTGDEGLEEEWEDAHTACRKFVDKEACEGKSPSHILTT